MLYSGIASTLGMKHTALAFFGSGVPASEVAISQIYPRY